MAELAEVSERDRELVDKIRGFLRDCKRVQDVNACFSGYRPELVRLWKLGGWNKTACIIIKNLQDYQIKRIKEGWIK
jgi:hypothetical protein